MFESVYSLHTRRRGIFALFINVFPLLQYHITLDHSLLTTNLFITTITIIFNSQLLIGRSAIIIWINKLLTNKLIKLEKIAK